MKKRICAILCVAVAAVTAAVGWFLWGRGEIAAVSGLVTEGAETVELPAIMYHGLLKDPAYEGKYVISPAEWESDLCYLKNNGYTPIHMEELYAWQDHGEALPEKPILLTFDDGYYNNYLYAWPLAKRYGMKFIISPIGSCTDRFTGANDDHANYSHVTWPQINEMMDSGLVEFQNHSYDLHGSKGRLGAKKLAGETEEQYRALLTEDLGKLQERFQTETGTMPTVFAYPFGAISDGSLEILWDMGFRAAFTCAGRVNVVSKTEQHPVLGRFLRPHGISSEQFFAKIFS